MMMLGRDSDREIEMDDPTYRSFMEMEKAIANYKE
jgi:hypothetical protein